MKAQRWTVARFPSGDWTTGGKTDEPEYAECEVWSILAESRDYALKEAQRLRRNRIARERRAAAKEQS